VRQLTPLNILVDGSFGDPGRALKVAEPFGKP
jgi:hypothetical protein